MRGLVLRQEKPFNAKFNDEFMKGRRCPLKVRSAKSGHALGQMDLLGLSK